MPDLVPVSGDPFAPQMVPVSGDPFAPRTVPVSGDPFDPAAIASMTHAAPDQVQPYMHPNVPAAASAVAGFAAGGLQGAGMPLPDWAAHNPVQEALQNPDNAAGMGMGATLPKAALQELLQQGLSYGGIADRLGVSRNVVAGNIRDMGLEGYGQNWRPRRLTDAQARARENPQGKIDPTSDEQRLLRLKRTRRPLTESEQEDLSILTARLKPSAEPDYNFDDARRIGVWRSP